MSPLSNVSLPIVVQPPALAGARAAHGARRSIGAASALANSVRFVSEARFEPVARDTQRIASWHREWAEARRSLVTEAYLASARTRAGTLFDFAA